MASEKRRNGTKQARKSSLENGSSRKVAAGLGIPLPMAGLLRENACWSAISISPGVQSRMHSHPNEQFNFVLQGTLIGEINGIPFKAPKAHLFTFLLMHPIR